LITKVRFVGRPSAGAFGLKGGPKENSGRTAIPQKKRERMPMKTFGWSSPNRRESINDGFVVFFSKKRKVQ